MACVVGRYLARRLSYSWRSDQQYLDGLNPSNSLGIIKYNHQADADSANSANKHTDAWLVYLGNQCFSSNVGFQYTARLHNKWLLECTAF